MITTDNHTTAVPRAFTIVEAVFVMTIIGILAAIALPRYAGFIAREQVEAAAQRIVADLALAQHQARLASASRHVLFDAATESYTLVAVPDPDRPTQAYQVSLAKEPYRASIVSVSLGGDSEVIYDGYGQLDANGSVVIAVGNYQKVITLEKGNGRARINTTLGIELIE